MSGTWFNAACSLYLTKSAFLKKGGLFWTKSAFIKKGVLFRTNKSAFFDKKKKGSFLSRKSVGIEGGVFVTDEQGWALPILYQVAVPGFPSRLATLHAVVFSTQPSTQSTCLESERPPVLDPDQPPAQPRAWAQPVFSRRVALDTCVPVKL